MFHEKEFANKLFEFFFTFFIRVDSTLKLTLKSGHVQIFRVFKVKRYTFRGSNSALLSFVSLSNRGHLIMEKICSFRSKSFLYEKTSFWKGFIAFESKQEVTKVISL